MRFINPCLYRLRYRESPKGWSRGRRREQSQRSRGPSRDRPRETKTPRKEHVVALVDLDPRLNDTRTEPGEDFLSIPLQDDTHWTHMRTSPTPTDNTMVSQTLIENADLFAWTASDMSRVSPNIITHRLSVYKEARTSPKRKKMGEEKRDTARK